MAAMARPPTKKRLPVTGIRRRSPPIESRSLVPLACWSELADKKSDPLKTA